MISTSNVKFTVGEFYSCWKAINCVPCDGAFVVIFFKTMNNKTIIRFSFCDIRNNKSQGNCYQSQSSALADNTYLYRDYSGFHKNFIQ